ncbi:NIF3-like protein 1 [Ornithodoros turicata]
MQRLLGFGRRCVRQQILSLRISQRLKMDLASLVKVLNQMAPLEVAESWDNVGLLVEPTSVHVKATLLTNDLTLEVVDEAVNLGAQMIISYHPPIFAPLKALRQTSWKEKIIVSCLENKIAVYSPHTAWDVAQNGVNDWLLSCFQISDSKPVTASDSDPNVGAGRRVTLQEKLTVKEVTECVKKHLQLNGVRLALGSGKSLDSTIQSIAACAGSGGSVLKGCTAVDLLLTGEMSHHEVLDAAQRGTSVVLCDHSHTERGYLEHFAERLRHETQGIVVHVSSLDRGPLHIV